MKRRSPPPAGGAERDAPGDVGLAGGHAGIADGPTVGSRSGEAPVEVIVGFVTVTPGTLGEGGGDSPRSARRATFGTTRAFPPTPESGLKVGYAAVAGNPVDSPHVEGVVDDGLPSPDHHTPAWMDHALCRTLSPADFFPSDGVGVELAKRVCAECSVRTECLEYALKYRIDHGVWGGCSERERRRILRARRVATY
jgi:WhiB family redox-sensing transcriptional regulator